MWFICFLLIGIWLQLFCIFWYLCKWQGVHVTWWDSDSGGSRSFRTIGRGPAAVKFLGSGDYFDVPYHIPCVFVVSVGNKIHSVNIAYRQQIYNMLVMQSKFTRTSQKNFFKQVSRACPKRRPWIRLGSKPKSLKLFRNMLQ